MKNIKVVAFDADDTLWVNEPYFREAEHNFCILMSRFGTEGEIAAKLFKIEMKNLPLYGYGAKAFTLSLLETALELWKDAPVLQKRTDIQPITPAEMERVIKIGTSLLSIPMDLLDGVEGVLKELSGKYRLVVATKGDLLDQQKKLERSGLLPYFHHVEIMSDKKEEDYTRLIGNLDVDAGSFMMVGNSLKSDVLPVLALGGYAVYVPFYTTWAHEEVDGEVKHSHFYEIATAGELLKILG
ncbi:MAG: HAD family hydrolase [Bacteroidales bacterium]